MLSSSSFQRSRRVGPCVLHRDAQASPAVSGLPGSAPRSRLAPRVACRPVSVDPARSSRPPSAVFILTVGDSRSCRERAVSVSASSLARGLRGNPLPYATRPCGRGSSRGRGSCGPSLRPSAVSGRGTSAVPRVWPSSPRAPRVPSGVDRFYIRVSPAEAAQVSPGVGEDLLRFMNFCDFLLDDRKAGAPESRASAKDAR